MDEDIMTSAVEQSIPDAAMMDQNIDDLFGEPTDGLAVDALGVALPPEPLPSSVALRMMGKDSKGCCTKLAWSNIGNIAHVIDGGRQISLQSLVRSADGMKWILSKPSETPIVAPEGALFEHIQFNGFGVDLGTVDQRGVVRIYASAGTLSKMMLAPGNAASNDVAGDDLDDVVGLRFLPTYPAEARSPYISPATKIGDKWVTHMQNRAPNEQTLHHPDQNRSALCYVSRTSKFTMMYQNEGTWQKTSLDLETPESSAELLSHAAMVEQGEQLLLITHDAASRFRLYQISIIWNPTQNTRPGGPPYTTVNPSFQIVRLTMLDDITAQQADLAVLSDLRFIAPIAASVLQSDAASLPTVVAIFTRAFIPPTSAQQHSESFSIIARWNVETISPVLHEGFTKLKAKGSAAVPASTTILRRQEDIITNKLVLSVEPQYHNTVLAFVASDATIEFRDRLTMANLEPFGDPTTASSLPQAGFEHITSAPVAHIAMSPDGSSIAMAQRDNRIETKLMTFRYTWQTHEDGIGDTAGLIEAAVVCLARQCAILCCASAANEDPLALLPTDLDDHLKRLFIREIIKMTGRQLDFALLDYRQQQPLCVKDNLLRTLISAQGLIGEKPGSTKPTWAGKYASAFLSARLSCSLLLTTISRPEGQIHPSFVHGLRGLVRWSSDFLVYIADRVLTLRRATKSFSKSDSTLPAHEAFMAAAIEKESPILNLLLFSVTRTFIRFQSQILKQYVNAIRATVASARSVAERQQLEDLQIHIAKLPFKWAAFDQLMTDVDNSVRTAYTSNNIPTERRSEIELTLTTEPTIPAELHPVVKDLVDNALPKFMDNADLAALYFRDTTWLGIESAADGDGPQYDMIRKLPIPQGARLRMCRRCGAVVEDLAPEKMRDFPPWLVLAYRLCACGGYWVTCPLG